LVDPSQKPLAPLPPSRILACNPLGTLLGMASELLECGRARFQAKELEEAGTALEGAVRGGTDRALVREARYWLGETLFRLNRLEEAERSFLLVYQDAPASELGLHALHSLGWLALRLNHPSRALGSFDQAIKFSAAAPVASYGSHGRALALYALERYGDARDTWQALSAQSLPAPLAREVTFWLGETLGRLGEYAAAEGELRRFTNGGLHRLLETGILRLGWWAFRAGHPLESVKAFRWLLSAYPTTAERAWARAGLVMALLALDDFPGAREEARQLQALEPGHPLVVPSLLLLLHWSLEKDRSALAKSLQQELLALNLSPAARSYVLLLNGEASRREGQSGEARGHFQVVGSIQPGSLLAWRATLRLVQIDLETREFARALDEVGELLNQSLPPEVRGAALLLRGEAAYWGKAYESAAEAFARFLVELPDHPEARTAALSVAWAEFRLGRWDSARQRWLQFARAFPRDPRAGEALLLASELAGQSGDLRTARDLLDQFLAGFPGHPHAPVAKLNRAILELRAGQFEQGLTWLRELTAGASLSPFIGRIRLVTGVALLAARRSGEALAEFDEALRQGEDVLAHLGLGYAALAQGQWQKAERNFAQARDMASEPVRLLAEYGAAAAAFHAGKREEFTRAAAVLVEPPAAGSLVPRLTYVLAAIFVEAKRWNEARQWTLRLVNDFPGDEAVDDALARLGVGAVAVKEWPLVRESYQLLLTRYPRSPHAEESRVDLAEALLRTGAPTEARDVLEPFVASGARDPRHPRALVLLAEAQEASGERAKAIEALGRLVREHPSSELVESARMTRGRLLQEVGRWEEARQVWETVLNEGEARAEAGFRLGEAYQARGLHEEAAEAYMTSAYLAPQTSWGRRALLRAGQSFLALKEPSSAAIVYRKLLAQPGVEPELAREAKRALLELGQNP
ncbi:MAG: tetratricopeptide repeat protein, partial [Candidatus Rokubacteria bacterium]|nr:tetratricopeptide repeat protein [Candidatus Rokubacteria bacterium]